MALVVITAATLAVAGTASASPGGTESPASRATTSTPGTIGTPGTAGPDMPPSQPTTTGGAQFAALAGGCRTTYGISACISVDSSDCHVADFYVNTLSGLPAGTRFDAIIVDQWGNHAWAKKGILDHTGHYGAWRECLGTRTRLAVVVSDPSGTIIYYIASTVQ